MSEPIDPSAVQSALEGTAFAHLGDVLLGSYATGDFAGAVRLLDAVAQVAEELNHHPDVHLEYGRIEFELTSHDVGEVTARDLDLAARIQQLADEQGATAE
ncbi:4a-hydroxytetrahydrobiopterin dehydratase [Rathayibacter sp. YIM 133350]|uniref:4a-hydroxytetrahydrobiopterin dehydratase n=1 Tax=Rathayibacter sp. YIM 133350 TaxID=3131992 RepID=UPI00307EFDF7